MPRYKLTVKKIRSSLPVGRHTDGAGLYLRVRDTGSKTFVVFATVDGKRREITIGPYGGLAGEYSLVDARARAEEIQAVLKSGGSLSPEAPSEPAQVAEEVEGEIPTFGAFALEVVSNIEEGFRNKKHREQWRSTLTTYCASFWEKPITEVSTDDVLEVLQPIWLTKATTASRLRGRIERVLDAAKAKKIRSGENPAAWHGHLSALLPKKHKKGARHHPALDYGKLPSFWSKLCRLTSP